MATVISDVHLQNAWGFIDHEINFLEEVEAQKLCISQSVKFDLPVPNDVRIPLESSDVPNDLFVNVFYGPNGAGKSTILSMMNDSLDLINGLVMNYLDQQKTSLKRKSAGEWIEGKIPESVSKGNESGRLKCTNYVDNEFVKGLMQNFHNHALAHREDGDRVTGDHELWSLWEWPVKNRNSMSIKITGIHIYEGVDYRFKIYFEQLDLSQYAYGPDALHTPGRITNLGKAGFVVKCDLEPLEDTFEHELGESPSGPPLSLTKRVKNETDNYFGYVKEYHHNCCIPFVIADNFDIIVLGQLALPLHVSEDENKVWPPISCFLNEKRVKKRHQAPEDELNESERFLIEWASEYWFLNPTKISAEMEWYFEEGDNFVLQGLFHGHEDLKDKVEPLVQISKDLAGDYTFLGDSEPKEEDIQFDPRKFTMQSKDIGEIKFYNPLMQIVTDFGANALPTIHNYITTVKALEEDEDHDFKCSYLNDMPRESSDFAELVSILENKDKGRYLQRWYGFSKFSVDENQIPDDEPSKIDFIRGRLEFLFSEGLQRLSHHRKVKSMKTQWEELSQYNSHPSKSRFSKNGFRRNGEVDNHNSLVQYEHLSSGEKCLFNLICLLGNTEKTGPIYIDEPELSLHPAWQLKLGDLILDLIRFSRRQVFFASHSPDIVMPLSNRAFAIESFEGNE